MEKGSVYLNSGISSFILHLEFYHRPAAMSLAKPRLLLCGFFLLAGGGAALPFEDSIVNLVRLAGLFFLAFCPIRHLIFHEFPLLVRIVLLGPVSHRRNKDNIKGRGSRRLYSILAIRIVIKWWRRRE